MTFRARINIQGAVNFVPDGDDGLRVLFPDQRKAEKIGLTDFEKRPIERHYAIVQFDSQFLLPNQPGFWSTIDIDGHRVWVETDSEVNLDLQLAGVPSIEEILKNAGLTWLRGRDPKPIEPRAIFHLSRGVLAPHTDFDGQAKFIDPKRSDRTLLEVPITSAVVADLGEVSNFQLKLQRFDQTEPSTLTLEPKSDELEIWVRHFCDIARPTNKCNVPESDQVCNPDVPLEENLWNGGERDRDFVLNYAAWPDSRSLIRLRRHQLPYPQIASSFAGGLPIGDCSPRCGCSQSGNGGG